MTQYSLLVLAGFGNLHGNIEVWDLAAKKLISNPKSPDTTHFDWCPNGEHILTATTAPRLRVGNGYVDLFWRTFLTLLLSSFLLSSKTSPLPTPLEWLRGPDPQRPVCVLLLFLDVRLSYPSVATFVHRYQIWHYTGTLLHESKVDKNSELWEAVWQNSVDGHFPEPKISYKPIASSIDAPAQPQGKVSISEEDSQNKKNVFFIAFVEMSL